MKIILTHGYFLAEDETELQIMRPYPTLGLLYISAFLKQEQKDVTIIDSTFMSKNEWLEELERIQPKTVAFYTNLMTKLNVVSLIEQLKPKYPETVFVVGGPDVTYNVENYLNAGFDYAIIGEGEQTMNELCSSIENGTPPDEISGIAYLKNEQLIQNEARIKIKELQAIPFPDRDAIPIEKYLDVWKKHHGKRTLNISTQRGCPYTCKWCSTAVYGQSYRRNTPERVVAEILEMKEKYAIEALWFVDDVFTVSHKWLSDLHAEFKKNNLRIPFECITRAERLNDVVLLQLKEMGCFRIWIGAESGSQKIIERMDRRVTLETVQQMIRQTQLSGMEAGTFIMVGYPGESHTDVLATMDHIRKCNPDFLTITKAYPIKGTDLYTEIEQDITSKNDWKTSTDREIKFKLPYPDSYYSYAVRYLVNGWKAQRNKSLINTIKSKAALILMQLTKR